VRKKGALKVIDWELLENLGAEERKCTQLYPVISELTLQSMLPYDLRLQAKYPAIPEPDSELLDDSPPTIAHLTLPWSAMRSASATYLFTAITLVVCFSFVCAPYACAQQPSSIRIVGRWRSLETTKGGIGQVWELRSDGTADCSIGAVVTIPWRIENNQLILPPAAKDGSEKKYTMEWLGDNKLR
jgi:hypothetical protein